MPAPSRRMTKRYKHKFRILKKHSLH
jgi:hypothetical protein